ncbi:hypothetical protein [Amycolatopsis sp. NPDC051903]|uniref:hypothetical protein n=1 Tax=Amycolatopsis sp. NPDC051903 TaxID=3363936 RepID=UPI00379B3167
MRSVIVAAFVVVSVLFGISAAEASVPAPPECVPSTQFKNVGFELAKWEYLGTAGGDYGYRYSFNSWDQGTVTCTP